MKDKYYEGLSIRHVEDRMISTLNKVIRVGIRALAILMTLVILWGIGDVVWVIYRHIVEPPFMILKIQDILETFGAFLAVLIAIEIFLNITLYLREDVIHVKLVVATALMAIARKVIVFDYTTMSYQHVMATGIVVLALGATYFLILRKEPKETPHEEALDTMHL
ncbi:MAG: phosphate-starvation-inducible PsiE family protein [Desulfobacterales bacterium]